MPATRKADIVCPCGKWQTVTVTDATFIPSQRIQIPGWNHVRHRRDAKASEWELEGVCDECRDMMAEDE